MPLVVCGTPIGDPADASARLAPTLAAADVIAAEDTRRLRALARRLGIPLTGRVVSYFSGNEATRAGELVTVLRSGATVVLVSDAGMPAVSDPGYLLVAAAVAAGVAVTVVPGASAVTAALAVSGLPTDRWVFDGFLPRRAAERRQRIAALASESRTLVVLEAPHRIAASLADLAAGLGTNRPAVLCRELTKTWEQVVRAPLGDLAQWALAREVRGEITLVIAGLPQSPVPVDRAELARAVAGLVAGGASRRDAVTEVAEITGVSRRVVYAAATAPGGPRLALDGGVERDGGAQPGLH